MINRKFSSLLGKKIDIEELLRKVYGRIPIPKEKSEVRTFGDLVLIDGVIYGIYAGNGNVLTSHETLGVIVIPLPENAEVWRV